MRAERVVAMINTETKTLMTLMQPCTGKHLFHDCVPLDDYCLRCGMPWEEFDKFDWSLGTTELCDCDCWADDKNYVAGTEPCKCGLKGWWE